MAPTATSLTGAVDVKNFDSKAAPLSLPKHSYWFDFWVFVVFDIALFLVVYFIVP